MKIGGLFSIMVCHVIRRHPRETALLSRVLVRTHSADKKYIFVIPAKAGMTRLGGSAHAIVDSLRRSLQNRTNCVERIVPSAESDEEIFLKTIIPSRKETKTYRGGKQCPNSIKKNGKSWKLLKQATSSDPKASLTRGSGIKDTHRPCSGRRQKPTSRHRPKAHLGMIDIARRIAVIQKLLDEGSGSALTYAALECRLTIEQVCYDRLMISYGYISHDDLKKWQPRKVVEQVVADANEHALHAFTISISRSPVPDRQLTTEEFEAQEYVRIGEQVAIDPKKLERLWNALSKVALHVSFPDDKHSGIEAYGDLEKIRNKVLETVSELEKLKSGTLLAGPIEQNHFFACVGCGTEIRRVEKLLKDDQIISCPNPNCEETYVIQKGSSGTSFARRFRAIKCNGCGEQVTFPPQRLDRLRYGDSLDLPCPVCGCGNEVHLVAHHGRIEGGESPSAA